MMNPAPANMLTVDYSKKNLQKSSFKNKTLTNVSFVDSDLRGADFSGADLSGADFSNVKTGINSLNTVMLFMLALIVSMISGYVAMLAGSTIQGMLRSGDEKIRVAGFLSIALILAFIVIYYVKGGKSVIRNLLVPAVLISAVLGVIAYISGVGTGRGMFFIVVSLLLVVLMFIVGTAARAAAGVLSSSLLFIIVAAAGGMFGRSVGGGLGTIVLAIGCALISKRALSGAKGFNALRNIASQITSKFGTSFRNANLNNARFDGSKIHNADFTNADLSSVNWGSAKKVNCTPRFENP